jgi:4-amino-4-deoxy-L-arabinose transferase-like glycosyltransferase
VLSSLFWLAGGVFVYRIARRVSGPGAAVFSTAIFLFLPFAVVASRSFQPDPLMVMLVLASVLATVRYSEQPSMARHCLMSVVSSLAFLVKPMALFPMLAVFLMLSITRQGVRAIWSWASAAFLLATILPTCAVYAYGIASGVFPVDKEIEKTLLPQLLLSAFFWRGWSQNVAAVVGIPVLLAALFGTALIREKQPRALMLGLWVGYLLLCLIVNYNVATHDYYQLQLIPIAALGIAPLAALALRLIGVSPDSRRRPVQAALAVSVLGIFVLLTATRSLARLGNAPSVNDPTVAEEIGARVGHSTRTIYLSGDYGATLQYHGQLSGAAWPIASDLEWERLAGMPPVTAEQRFQTWFAQDSPEYFIVVDLPELEQQQDLKQFLFERFNVVAHEPSYWLFDLRVAGV